MKAPAFDNQGVAKNEVELPKIFVEKVDKKFLSDIVVRLFGNSRVYSAHTKKRDERRGGGIKPWKQKGTGRARQGSIRSPQWKKGGIVFGPRSNRNYATKINRKEMKRAMLQALSYAASQEHGMIVLENLSIEPKTKNLVALLGKLKADKSVLLVLPKADENVKRASQNLKNVSVKVVTAVTVVDILNAKTVVLVGDALKKIEQLVTL